MEKGAPQWADGFIHPHAKCLIYFWYCVYAGLHTALSGRDGSPSRAALTRCRHLFVQLAHLASGSIVQILQRSRHGCHRRPLRIYGYGFAANFFFLFSFLRELLKMKHDTFHSGKKNKKKTKRFCAQVAWISALSICWILVKNVFEHSLFSVAFVTKKENNNPTRPGHYVAICRSRQLMLAKVLFQKKKRNK